MEGDSNHTGQLSSSLCPEVLEAKIFSSKLLKTYVVGGSANGKETFVFCTVLTDKINAYSSY